MSLASALGLDNEIALLRNRGFMVSEARIAGGPDGKFRVGSNDLDACEIRALANRLADRWPANPFLPRQQPPQSKPKDPPMPDRFRGLTEAAIRADMEQLCEEHDGPGAAARACGLASSTFGNTRKGIARIGETVMNALYGPDGTTLRAEIRKQQSHETPAGEAGGDAGSDLAAMTPADQEPVASPADSRRQEEDAAGGNAGYTEGAAAPETETTAGAAREGKSQVVTAGETANTKADPGPAWMRGALLELVDQDERLACQIGALKAEQAKVHRAIDALKALA